MNKTNKQVNANSKGIAENKQAFDNFTKEQNGAWGIQSGWNESFDSRLNEQDTKLGELDKNKAERSYVDNAAEQTRQDAYDYTDSKIGDMGHNADGSFKTVADNLSEKADKSAVDAQIGKAKQEAREQAWSDTNSIIGDLGASKNKREDGEALPKTVKEAFGEVDDKLDTLGAGKADRAELQNAVQDVKGDIAQNRNYQDGVNEAQDLRDGEQDRRIKKNAKDIGKANDAIEFVNAKTDVIGDRVKEHENELRSQSGRIDRNRDLIDGNAKDIRDHETRLQEQAEWNAATDGKIQGKADKSEVADAADKARRDAKGYTDDRLGDLGERPNGNGEMQKNTVKDVVDAANDRISAGNKRINEVEKEARDNFADADSRLDKHDTKIKQNADKIASNSDRLDGKTGSFGKNSAFDTDNGIGNDGRNLSVEDAVNANRKEINKQQTHNSVTDDAIEGLGQQGAEHGKQIAENAGKIAENKAAQDKMNSDQSAWNTKTDGDISGVNAKTETNKGLISENAKRIANNTSDIDKNSGLIAENADKIASNSDRLNGKTGAFGQWEGGSNKTVEQGFADHDKRLNAHDVELDTHQQAIEGLGEQNVEQGKQIAENSNRLGGHDKTLDTHEKRLNTNERNIANVNDKTDRNADSIRANRQAIDKNKEAIADVNERVDDIADNRIGDLGKRSEMAELDANGHFKRDEKGNLIRKGAEKGDQSTFAAGGGDDASVQDWVDQGKAAYTEANERLNKLNERFDTAYKDGKAYVDAGNAATLKSANDYTDRRYNQLNGKVKKLRARADSGIAGATAIGTLAFDSLKANSMAGGLAVAKNKVAGAVGYQRNFNENWRARGTLSVSDKYVQGGASVGYSW